MEEKMTLSEYVFWLHSMTTTELILQFPKEFHLLSAGDSTDESVKKVLANDAILWRKVREYNKKLYKESKKPSDFVIFPLNSVFGHSVHEIIAKNIMAILARNGNVFRKLSWEEYTVERLKDSEISSNEQVYFDLVRKYTVSPEVAGLFSEAWNTQGL